MTAKDFCLNVGVCLVLAFGIHSCMQGANDHLLLQDEILQQKLADRQSAKDDTYTYIAQADKVGAYRYVVLDIDPENLPPEFQKWRRNQRRAFGNGRAFESWLILFARLG